MLSKFARVVSLGRSHLTRRWAPSQPLRPFMGLVPPDQYDYPMTNKLRLGHAIRTYWEIIPLVVVTLISVGLCVFSILWAFGNKVDCTYTSRSRESISRTMDLCNPTTHKLILINQRYEPWPEMQFVLNKMKDAEKRALMRMQSCSYP